ncbi:diguanylate cyclase [Azospira restricta]|uniref:diguanylate cyclase n=1 Tax=Azospira restricta TaxID=404405 RepID=A0A974Y3E2_9RHOO|nr:diguanylate cyclase [Azospira restricta]QRJ63756.1 diguanylate cyclase [Azospira restricta]
MTIRRLRHKVPILLMLTLSLGFTATAFYYMASAERAIRAENERSLHKLTESIVTVINTVMLDDHAEIMREYTQRMRSVEGLADFRILRRDGSEAFVDNRTIDAVNATLGEEAFARRRSSQTNPPLLDPAQPAFARALGGEEAVSEIESGRDGERMLRFFDPIATSPKCFRCHGRAGEPRGVVMVATSLAAMERSVQQVRFESFSLLALTLVATMLLTGYMLGRTIVRPIETVTEALSRISSGDFTHNVAVQGNDEIGHLAAGFNAMTSELRSTYDHMQREGDKLRTIVEGAQTAVIATDASGKVVIVNQAATEYLGKSAEQIVAGGIENVFDNPATMQHLLAQDDQWEKPPERTVTYNGRVFLVSAATISDEEGAVLGSAALLQDVTEEKRLLDELRRLSTTDALTGLYNRRHLDNTLKREVERSKLSQVPLSVVLFDVDHFKRFNDEHGHDQGDRVLQAVGQWMHQVTRQYDTPCRYGGEEFVLILPATTTETAVLVAERLRKLVEASTVDGLAVTISLGVASTTSPGLIAPEALIEAADSALYRSKHGGRNRTTAYGETGAAADSAPA